MTKEIPLRPNRREDTEFGREDFYPTSQVFLPDTKPMGRKKSSGGDSGKSWLKHIKSPIGEFRVPRVSSLLITASSRHDAIGQSFTSVLVPP